VLISVVFVNILKWNMLGFSSLLINF